MSLRFFKARTLIFTEAGLAAISRNSPGLKGFGTPFCSGLAGTIFPLDLHEAGNGEDAGALGAQILLDLIGQSVNHLGYVILVQSRGLGDILQNLGLAGSFWGSFCHWELALP